MRCRSSLVPGHEPWARRDALKASACGFGYLAFANLATAAAGYENPLAPRAPHFAPRAKRVIFLFMNGGPSQMDTFDYKPRLNKDHGKPGQWKGADLYGSPYKFKRHGESGLWASELFPKLAKRHIDDLCFIHSMQTDSAAHPTAVPFMHTGSFRFIRPSVGSWVLYGLGTENQELPGFITINPTKKLGGAQNYGNAFLPACYQGTAMGEIGRSTKDLSINNLSSNFLTDRERREQIDLVQQMNQGLLARRRVDPNIEGVISSLELSSRMQSSVPQVVDFADESEETLAMYGIGQKDTDDFGRQCLLARRFAEAGVRFIQLSHDNWDQHTKLTVNLPNNCRETDQPITALLTDLQRRGLWEDTLVVWTGEFGRLPEIEFGDGRSHNNTGFTLWLAGGGVKGGMAYGKTDEHGRAAVENPVHMHDLHATILHLLGLDHRRLTYRYSGRDYRLTDVHGNVVTDIQA